MGIEAVANKITGDMCDKINNIVVGLPYVPQGKACVHMKTTYRQTLHDRELLHVSLQSMNDKYIIH